MSTPQDKYHREYQHNFDARRRGWTVNELIPRSLIWRTCMGICQICGQPADPDTWEVDHCIPRNKGGTHDLLNLDVSCKRHNRMKHRSWPYFLPDEEWEGSPS